MVKSSPSGRPGRRAGDSGTRDAILAASRARFIAAGFRGATIRAIAAEAGVDPALVLHFFGSKERLFSESVHLPVDPAKRLHEALECDRETAGAALVEFLLDTWDSEDANRTMLAIVRSAATDEPAARMIREQVVGAVAQTLRAHGMDRADYRAALVASQMAGLAIGRYMIGLPPLVEADRAALVEAFGPTVQRYLTGALERKERA